LGPTGYGNSPYQALSSFAGNGLLVSPDWLIEDGLLTRDDCAAPLSSPFAVDYNAVIPFKQHLLEKARINFTKTGSKELRVAFEKFCHEQAHWLEDYALFRAMKFRYNGAYYLEWPRELVQRLPKVRAQARNDLANQIDQVCFAQFLLFRQGERLQKHARAKGLRLIGDLPFFVSPDSSDVWANPELFLPDDQRRPRFRAAFHLIILAHRASSGVTHLRLGDLTAELAIAGASIVFALCSCVDVICLDHFRGSQRRGMFRRSTYGQNGQLVPGKAVSSADD
jgi:4-alpha-glucanotransferase